MELKIITNQQEWDHETREIFLFKPFTQSFEWGEIMEKEGKRVERLVVVNAGKIIAQAQIIYSRAIYSTYAFCPKGPIFISSSTTEEKNQVFRLIANYLQEQGCLFFRIEPIEVLNEQKSLICKKSIDINPRATVLLDLGLPEEQLLLQMHHKTRYNIRLAQKKEVVVEEKKDIKIFMNLMKVTGERDKFKLHGAQHYEYILYSSFAHQLCVSKDGQVIATGVFVGFGDTFTYLYGASDYRYRQYMAPYLVQWKGIELGKKLGYTQYDFFGIAPTTIDEQGEYHYDQKHQYAGVTRFKLGFGGKIQLTPGTFDIILKPTLYSLYQTVRKLRRLI